MNAVLTKTCTRCDAPKPLDQFRPKSGRCLECRREVNRERRAADPEGTREYNKRYHRLHKYGMTAHDYDTLLARQNGVCALCFRPPRTTAKRDELMIDHDHATGKVRGLLCQGCNVALGMFQDDPELLKRAIAYVGGDSD